MMGRTPIYIVFFRNSSEASVHAVLDLQKTTAKGGNQEAKVVAVNVGEPLELVRKGAAQNGLTAIVVADPQQHIAEAYNARILPTIIHLDPSGIVRSIRYGRYSDAPGAAPSGSKTAAAR